MKIRKLQLAARFALCKFFHDSGILFVELIQYADDQNDGFGKIQRAVHPRVVMEHILAVVRQNRADNSLIGALEHPEQQDSPEILIGDQRLEAVADRNLFLRAGCDVYGFLALDKAVDEQQESDCGPDAHYLDPGRLIVAKRCTLRHRRRKPGVSEY